MNYYYSKDNLFNDLVLDSMNQRKWIEILPKSKNAFDLTTFIDFADSLTPNYIVNNFSTNNNVKIKAVHMKLTPSQHSIKINILNKCSEFKVFVKDGLHYIQNTQISGVNYIYFQPFTINNTDQINYFSKNDQWAAHLSAEDSVFSNLQIMQQSKLPILRYTLNMHFAIFSQKKQ